MARNDPTIYMRIPVELKEKLDAAAEENRRSMTAEVVARLQSTFYPHAELPYEFGEPRDLIVDQAKQLWEMRCRYAATHIYLMLAKRSLEELGYADMEKLRDIEEVLKRNQPHVERPLSLRSELLVDSDLWRSELPEAMAGFDSKAAKIEPLPALPPAAKKRT